MTEKIDPNSAPSEQSISAKSDISRAITLPEYVAKSYELEEPSFVRTQRHLCLYCDLFFQHVRKGWQLHPQETVDKAIVSVKNEHSYPHWPKFSQLRIAATEGCHICQLFQSQLTTEEQQSLLNFERTNCHHGIIHLVLPSRYRRPGLYEIRLKFEPVIFSPLTMEQVEASACNFDMVTEQDVDKRLRVWESAFSWITNCVVNHSGCHKQFLKSCRRPRRLIAVGDRDSEVLLRKSSTLEPETLYVTLSHCWGPKGVPFKLQKANESTLSERIPIDKLSLTFKDAIRFTRRLRILGVRYIWIDALCIIQDSEEDWQDQAFIMGEIYGSAFCNLAACTGPDGSSGLYPHSDGISRRLCTLKAGASSCISGSFAVRDRNVMRSSQNKSTILSRAWCVQELMLAPRVLYFAHNHTVWECSALLAEDSLPTRHIDLKDGYDFSSGRKFRYKGGKADTTSRAASLVSEAEDSFPFNYYSAWMEAILTYTECDLTYHTDRLVGISGIARLIHAGLGEKEKYIAGLWGNYLPLHLVWEVRSTHKNYRLWPYRAPSWSWASVEGRVYNFLTNSEAVSSCTTFVQVSAEVDLATTDPFGPVRGAILHLKGPVFKAFLGSRGHTSAKHLCRLFIDAGDNARQDKGPECIVEHPIHLDFDYPGHEPVRVYCILVMTTAIQDQIAGLLLVPQEDSKVRGRYIRIGISHNLPSKLLVLARNSWRLGDDREYEAEIKGGDYQISIV